MEGRVDFSSLDRSRLLGTLPSGSLGHLFAAGGEPSTSSALSRLSAASAAAAAASAGVSPSELPRPGSPSTLQQYVGRFLPSSGLHSPGASYAMMAGYLANTGHIPESLKHLMPDFQQYWASAQSEGYARYLLNNIYYPYLPYLPATDTLSLFAQNSANAQLHAALQGQGHHRIYDLQKGLWRDTGAKTPLVSSLKQACLDISESLFNTGAVPRGFYPPHLFPTAGQLEATNLTLPSSSKARPHDRDKEGEPDFKDEDRKEGSLYDKDGPDKKGNGDTEKDRHTSVDKSRIKVSPTHKTSKGFSSKTDDKDKIKSSCKSVRTERYSQNPNQCNINQSKGIASSSNSKLYIDVDSTPNTDTETRVIKDMIDSACRERDRKRSEHTDPWLKHSPLLSPTRHDRVVSPDRRSVKAYSPVSKKHSPSQSDISISTVQVQDVPENLCVKDKKRSKSGDVKSESAVSKEYIRTQSVVTGTTITVTSTQNVFTSEQMRSESSVDTHNGKGSVPSASQLSPTNKKTTVTTYSLPYYHNLYSRSTPDGKKVHAVTYVPEIGTISSPVAGAPSVINVIDTHKGRDNTQALNLSNSELGRKSEKFEKQRGCESSDQKEKIVSDTDNDKNEIDVINIDVDEVCDFSKRENGESKHHKYDVDSLQVCKGVRDTQDVEKTNLTKKKGSDDTISLKERGINPDHEVIDVDKLDEEGLETENVKCDLTENSILNKMGGEKPVIKKIHSDETSENKRETNDNISDTKSDKINVKSDGPKDSEKGSKHSCDVNHNSENKSKSSDCLGKLQKTSMSPSSQISSPKSTVSHTSSAIDLSKSMTSDKEKHSEGGKDNKVSNNLKTQSQSTRDNKNFVKKQTSPVKPIIARSRIPDSNSKDKESPLGSHSVSSPSRSVEQPYKIGSSKHQESQQPTQGQSIPVGIAVARQRTIAPKVPGSNDKDGRKTTDDSKSKSQTTDVKPIRPLKIIRPSTKGSSTTVTDKRNELPANLIVTGGSTTQGVFWPDDPASRQLAAQVLQNSHPITPTTWYSPTQFSLPQGIVTTTSEGSQGNQLPLTVPPGYKLAQDSLTGQILLIPTGNDVYDTSRVFGYPLGTQIHQGSTFVPPVITGQQNSSPLPTTPTLFPPGISDRPTTLDFSVPQFPQIYNASVLPGSEVAIKLDKGDLPSHHSTSSVVAPPVIIQSGQDGAAVPANLTTEREIEKDKIQPAIVTDISLATGQTFTFQSSNVPFVFNSNSLLPSQTIAETSPDVGHLKQEHTTVQSRGTSPMLPATDSSAEDNEECSAIADVKSCSESEDIVETVSVSDKNLKCDGNSTVIANSLSSEKESIETSSDTCRVSTNTSTDDCDSVKSESNSVNKKEITERPAVDLSNKQSQGSVTQLSKSGEFKDDVKIKSDSVISSKTISSSKNDPVCSVGSKPVKSDRNIFTDLTEYNPFTDPHVLQAADGLELLSALAVAEKTTLNPNTEDNDADTQPLLVASESETKDDVYTFKDDQSTPGSKPDKKPILNIPGIEKAKVFPENGSESMGLSDKIKSRVRCGHAFKPRKKEDATPTSPSPKRMMTFCGITIPEDDDVIDSIEMEMKMRLAELQRRYREKQRELARLTPKRDKESDKDTEKSTLSSDKSQDSKRGPGRPKKRKHETDDSREGGRLKGARKEGSNGTSQSGHKTHGLNKKKRMAELLVDRVFRKTGSSFKIPLSKKVSLIAPARIEFPCTATSSAPDRTDRPETARHNKPIDFGKLIKRSRFSQFGGKERGFVGGFWHKKDERKKQKHSLFHATSMKKKKREKSVSVENGLGLLAEYATKSQDSHSQINGESGGKRKAIDNFSNVPSPESPNKKRKPGRPKKCDVIRPGITETIVAKQSKHIDFFRWQTEARKEEPKQERKISLEGKTPLKPLYLDEWNVRRSERIFLNDPSPQTSPNAVSPDGKSKKEEKTKDTKKEGSRKPEQPKKSRSVNLSQKVKKKYSTVMTQQKSKFKTEQLKASRDQLSQKRKEQKKKRMSSGHGGASDSEADDLPLSSFRPQQKQLAPNCVMEKDELQDGVRILVFMDGLFHEGELKAIRPPDIYGAILDNERKTRPHYFSQEEILKDAIKDVKPTSKSQLKEGTRICAYWSQQFSCLYPGTISRGSPDPDDSKEDLLNVEFDDGDTGRIPLDHIRIIPQDFPLVEYDPNPLLFLTKRRRTVSVSETGEPRKSVSTEVQSSTPVPAQQSKDKVKRGPGRPPKVDRLLSNDSVGGDDVFVAERKKADTKDTTQFKEDTDNDDDNDDDDMEVALLTPRGLWSWSGSPTKRPGLKGKAKKEYYKTIVRGRESISVGESAVFLSIGRPNLPYVGRIESLWESWGGHMTVKVKWFYHPEETKGGKRLQNMKGALFRSDHEDDNDVQTISHKCDVIPYAEYRRRKDVISLDDNEDVYYLAGSYQPTIGHITFEPGVLCN